MFASEVAHDASGDHPNAEVLDVIKKRDANGVYKAKVAITDPNSGQVYTENSTMFPDS